jgi:hypothetical protein
MLRLLHTSKDYVHNEMQESPANSGDYVPEKIDSRQDRWLIENCGMTEPRLFSRSSELKLQILKRKHK